MGWWKVRGKFGQSGLKILNSGGRPKQMAHKAPSTKDMRVRIFQKVTPNNVLIND